MCRQNMIWFNNPDNGESTPAQLWEYRNELTKRFIIILGRLTAEVGSRFESSTTMPHYLFLMRDVIMRLKSLDFNWHLVYSSDEENCLRIMQHDCCCGFKNQKKKTTSQ